MESEELELEGMKREGLAPGFFGLVHHHIKGRKTGALKHQRSMEGLEDGNEICLVSRQWHAQGSLLQSMIGLLEAGIVKAIGESNRARVADSSLPQPPKTPSHHGRRGMYTEYKASFTNL